MATIGAIQASFANEQTKPSIGVSIAVACMAGILGAIIALVGLHLELVGMLVGIFGLGTVAFFVPGLIAKASYTPTTLEVGEHGVAERTPRSEKIYSFDDYDLHQSKTHVTGRAGSFSLSHVFLVKKGGRERAISFDPEAAANAVREAHQRHRRAKLRSEPSPRFTCIAGVGTSVVASEVGAFVVHDAALEVVSGQKRALVPWSELRVDVKDGYLFVGWKSDSVRVLLSHVADVDVLLELLHRCA